LEMNSFLIWHIFLEIGKTQDLMTSKICKIWQTLGDAVKAQGDILKVCV
jgi:hypothetical protein